MKTLAYAPVAQADIERIWDHSAKHWGSNQGDRYTDEIRDAWRWGRVVLVWNASAVLITT